jgi:hypothetical protein
VYLYVPPQGQFGLGIALLNLTMAEIVFPEPLKGLLEKSRLQVPIRILADRVGEVLADNKLPFFPDYTDHGIDHINCVLKPGGRTRSRASVAESVGGAEQRGLEPAPPSRC